MSKIDDLIAAMQRNPNNVRFADAVKVCSHYFGEPRQVGTSHCIYKMPWAGDPRINIQKRKDGKAKGYQIRQALEAIERLGEIDANES